MDAHEEWCNLRTICIVSGSFGGSVSNLRLAAARIEPAASRQSLHVMKLPNFTRFSGLVLSQRSCKESNRCLFLAAKNAQCKQYGWYSNGTSFNFNFDFNWKTES